MQDDCAERPRGRLCGMAVQAEKPRGRDWLAACRLALSKRDSSDCPATLEIKLGINPFTPRTFYCHFFGHTEPIVNLSGAETHRQDKFTKDSVRLKK